MALHNDFGHLGEDIAARYLVMHGYHIRERDWHCGHCDIDIIAERKGTLVMVEVKARHSDLYGQPEDAVDDEKKSHIITSASAYLRMRQLDMPLRFDIICVLGTPPLLQVKHIRNAFNILSLPDRKPHKPQ
jgi:putative endonuclease